MLQGGAVPGGLLHTSFGYVLLVAWWTVLVAELGGDKTLYTVASLALQFRAPMIVASATLAFALKMFIAAILGRSVGRLPLRASAGLSAAAFLLTAVAIWLRKPAKDRADEVSWHRAAAVSFGSLFFTEWGDPGQVAAAALAASTGLLLPVWLGGTIACVTKTVLALMIGLKVRNHVSPNLVRVIACASCVILGIVALTEAAVL